MDYEVFLLSRIKEAYDESGNSNKAVALGLKRSGRITSAAGLVMIVFIGFALGENLGIKEMGLALAIAVASRTAPVRRHGQTTTDQLGQCGLTGSPSGTLVALVLVLLTMWKGSTLATTVKLGVIGCGSVAQNAYLPLAANLRARGELSGIVVSDPDPQRLESARARFDLEAVTSTNEDLLSDPTIDVVAILTSMNEHADLTIAALRAGKHVLVEKPMATTLEAGRAVLAAADAAAGHLVCAPHVMLSPDYQAMLRFVRDDALGQILLGRARYGWEGPNWSSWFYAPGGGPLFDLGVYNVTSLTGLLGPVARVSCLSRLSRPQREVAGELITVETEDTFQLTLEHVGGALTSVTTAFGMQKYRTPAIELYGLRGTVQMLGDDWAPAGLELYTNEVGNWQVIESEARYWPWTDGLAHLVSSVRTGTTPYASSQQAFHVLEIMLAAMESARTGMTVAVESRFAPLPPQPDKERRAAHLIHDRVHEEAQ